MTNDSVSISWIDSYMGGVLTLDYAVQFSANGASGLFADCGTLTPCSGSITVGQPSGGSQLAILPVQLQPATVGQAYGPVQLHATGGTSCPNPAPPYSWSWSSNMLPAGMQLTAGGVIQGTPQRADPYQLPITVTDCSTPPQTAQTTLSLTVNSFPPLQFTTPANLPSGMIHATYNQTLAVSGGESGAASTLAYQLTEGSLPNGVNFNLGTGVIAGTPTETGSFGFTVVATEACTGCTASKAFNLFVGPQGPLTITSPSPSSPSLGNLVIGKQLPFTFAATGGQPPYSWNMNPVPYGLQLSPQCLMTDSGCVLSGTPVAPIAPSSNEYYSLLTVTDSSAPQQRASLTVFSFAQTPPMPPKMEDNSGTDTVVAGTTSYQYDFDQLIVGGQPFYSCAFSLGQTAVPGVSFSVDNGHCYLNGAPTNPGPYSFNVEITDSSSPEQKALYTLNLTATQAQTGSPSATPVINANGIVNAAGGQATITPGGIATVYGNGLADAVYSPSSTPLPTSLGNVQVAVNGQNAPLYYVSPTQVNFQAPLDSAAYYPLSTVCLQSPVNPATYYPINCPPTPPANVRVSRNGVTSATMSVPVAPSVPGVFTYIRVPGTADPVIVGGLTNQLVTPTSPAHPGDTIVAYATGIGIPTCFLASGQTSGSTCFANSVPQFTFPDYSSGLQPQVQYAGMTPDSVGLAQFNLQLPTTLPAAALVAGAIRMRVGDATNGQTFNLYLGGGGPTAASIVIVSGNSQAASVNQAFAAPLVVRVSDAQGNPLNGVNVSFTVTSGSASIGTSVVATNGSGQASASVTAGSASGPVAITATAGSFAVQFALTVTQLTPTITSLSPPSASSGSSAFTLIVNGSNFALGATVQWNGTDLPTTFVSSTQLTASVGAGLIASTGTAAITVFDGGLTSAPVSFTITSGLGTTCPTATATEGVSYSSQLVGSGGTPPYFWTVVHGGNQPSSGLSLNSNTGLVSGIPVITGDLFFTFTIIDSTGATAQQTCQIVVSAP